MKTFLHALLVGPAGPLNMIYDRSLVARGYVLVAVSGYPELYDAEMCEGCEIAVLHPALSREELTEAAHLVRRRWPSARILMIRAEEWEIEDALYDDRVAPGVDPELLCTVIERLAGFNRAGIIQEVV